MSRNSKALARQNHRPPIHLFPNSEQQDAIEYRGDEIERLTQRIEDLELRLKTSEGRYKRAYESLSLDCVTVGRNIHLLACVERRKVGRCVRSCQARTLLIAKINV